MNPIEVTNIELAFPAQVSYLMPSYDEIPDEFKWGGGSKWIALFNAIFFFGVNNLQLIPKKDVDPGKAWRHIQCIMGSYAPKHEHKTAAVAYLLNQWFEDATWERTK